MHLFKKLRIYYVYTMHFDHNPPLCPQLLPSFLQSHLPPSVVLLLQPPHPSPASTVHTDIRPSTGAVATYQGPHPWRNPIPLCPVRTNSFLTYAKFSWLFLPVHFSSPDHHGHIPVIILCEL